MQAFIHGFVLLSTAKNYIQKASFGAADVSLYDIITFLKGIYLEFFISFLVMLQIQMNTMNAWGRHVPGLRGSGKSCFNPSRFVVARKFAMKLKVVQQALNKRM